MNVRAILHIPLPPSPQFIIYSLYPGVKKNQSRFLENCRAHNIHRIGLWKTFHGVLSIHDDFPRVAYFLVEKVEFEPNSICTQQPNILHLESLSLFLETVTGAGELPVDGGLAILYSMQTAVHTELVRWQALPQRKIPQQSKLWSAQDRSRRVDS